MMSSNGTGVSSHLRRANRLIALAAAVVAALAMMASSPAGASVAYGDLNNFDVFNDTNKKCYGFEIELEGIHSTDVTYTFDWNHYGPPTITEDSSVPKVLIRHAAKFDPTTSTFTPATAYTDIPSSPPSPTNGHQCTNTAVNIGCEHFGVGHYGNPTAVKYYWLIEDPSAPGTLVRGPAVNVATPSWTYYPPDPAQNQNAQVQAVILAPPPPPEPVELAEFGDAVWVKSIVTESHNNRAVKLEDLVSDDPDDPSDENWANGEPEKVEVEWQILQTEFNNPAGANNELEGGREDLGAAEDEVITRRYEFYKYAGPFKEPEHEAMCDKYPQISDPADPDYKAECDPATVGDILGDYIGAQMAGFDAEAPLGLIDHVQDGVLGEPYTPRTVVVGGNAPYQSSVTSGALPPGLDLNSGTGVLTGTPTAAGVFSFRVEASDSTDPVPQVAAKDYTMTIDACPDDPAKIEPGACGCGVPDTDADGDSIPDCDDPCLDNCSSEPCQNSGVCTDVVGCYSCACLPGFSGTNCENVSGCDPACGANATCNAPTCECDSGYEGDPVAGCTDIDGCASNPCFPGVTCTDVAAPGTGFTCGDCPAGSFGDGESCTACTNCGANAHETNACTSTADTVCACDSGYEGDPVAGCTDIDECATDNGGCGDPAASSCSNNAGAPPICTDVDGCASNPCDDAGDTGAICHDVAAPGTGNTCTCSPGHDDQAGTCIANGCESLLDGLRQATETVALNVKKPDKTRDDLLDRVDRAAKELGKNKDRQAIHQLDAYTRKVEHLVDKGQMSATDGAGLLARARATIDCIDALP